MVTCVGVALLCAGAAGGCPATCECVQRGGGIAVFCIAHNLTSIPLAAIPDNTEELYLKANHITRLTQGSFEGLESLRTLVINECHVTSIEPNTFTSLKQLGSLDLTKNNIRELSSFTFSGLSHLRRLILDDNALRIINNFAFNGLNLTKLSIERNPALAELAPMAFEGARVHDLYIINANLTSSSTAAFKVRMRVCARARVCACFGGMRATFMSAFMANTRVCVRGGGVRANHFDRCLQDKEVTARACVVEVCVQTAFGDGANCACELQMKTPQNIPHTNYSMARCVVRACVYVCVHHSQNPMSLTRR